MTYITNISKRYASALFEVAKEAGIEERMEKEFQLLKTVLEKNSDVLRIFLNPVLCFTNKIEIIEKISTELNLSKIMNNFLKLIIEKQKFSMIGSMCEAYLKLLDNHMGRMRIKLVSAMPVPQALSEKAKSRIEKKYNKNVLIEEAVDPGILGGVIIQMDFRIFDGSLKNQLASLKAKLISE
jgi:F-type H+-transporting ATPase subunit delta